MNNTDLGNARRLIDRHGCDLRHCYPWRRWLLWDGCRWLVDEAGEITRRAKDALAHHQAQSLRRMADIREALPNATEDEKVKLDSEEARLKALLVWLTKSESDKLTAAMISQARSEPGMPVLPSDLDTDPWLLNVPNGTVDLRTGRLRDHNRADLLTQLCPTSFNPKATCPIWERTILAIFAGKQHLVDYVQRLLGYCLTGAVNEQILPIFHGSGANGKSLVFEVARQVLGSDYAMVAAPELLKPRRSETHSTGVADLFRKRLVTLAETAEGGRLNETEAKSLTGSEAIKARKMRQDNWEFFPTHKLIVATNHRPEIRGTDHGIWRRVRLIPFEVRFWDESKGESGPPELKADKDLRSRLQAEQQGILAWMVRGCLAWQADGMREPAEVLMATASYRNEQDMIAAFIADCCDVAPNLIGGATAIYKRYVAWHTEQGNEGKAMSQTKFGGQLGDRGYEKRHSGGTIYAGIDVKPATELDLPW